MGSSAKEALSDFEDDVKGEAKRAGDTIEEAAKDAEDAVKVVFPVHTLPAIAKDTVKGIVPDIDIPDPGDVTVNIPEEAMPATIDNEGAAAAEAERFRRRQAQGRGSTILTGSLGLSAPANVGTAMLLG